MKHLLQHFTALSLHPKNAKELKGLILQLAVQGKLTANWREEHPDVEPASVLLERIKEEKVKLIAAKKIRKEKTLPEITEEELQFDLPSAWAWCRLGDLNYDVHYGYTASAQSTFGNIGLLRITDIQDNKVNWNTVPDCVISEKDFPKYELKENDILIARTGGTIGKSFIVKGVSVKSVFASYLIRAIPVIEIYAEYEKLFIETPFYWQQLRANSQGTGQPNVNATALKGLVIPLPPLKEQKAIVKTVNQLFTEVEQLEALTKKRIQLKKNFATSALQQLTNNIDTEKEWTFLQAHFSTFFTEQSNVKKLRESILKLAVQGKLTKHWRKENPDVEDASVLLERIKEEKAKLVKEKKIKKEKPLPEITEEEIPYELPEGWVWCRLKELGFITGGGTPSKGKATYWDGDILWVSPKDMKSEFISDSKDKITIEGVENSSTKLIPEGSLLIVGRSGILKRTIPISINTVECTVNQDMKVVVPYIKAMNIFIKLSLKGMEARLLKHFVKYGMTVHSLRYSEFELLTIPLPPLEEQKAIIEKVNLLMTLCDQLAQEIQTSKATQEDWMKSSLRDVFETPQATVNN